MRDSNYTYWIPNVQITRRNSNDWSVLFVHLVDFEDVLSTKPNIVVCFVPTENNLYYSSALNLGRLTGL